RSNRQRELGPSAAGDFFEAPANALVVLGEVVQARELKEPGETEDALEERRRLVADRTALLVAARFGDQPSLDQTGNGRVGRHPANAGDLRARDRARVGDDRERLERGLREPTLHRPLDESGARLGGLPRRPKRVTAGDLLEHDPASAFAVAR